MILSPFPPSIEGLIYIRTSTEKKQLLMTGTVIDLV